MNLWEDDAAGVSKDKARHDLVGDVLVVAPGQASGPADHQPEDGRELDDGYHGWWWSLHGVCQAGVAQQLSGLERNLPTTPTLQSAYLTQDMATSSHS